MNLSKYKTLMLIFILLLIIIINVVSAKEYKPLKGHIITIDPGHGGIGIIQKLMVLL